MENNLVESILIDTKNKKYQINGQDISNDCTRLELIYHDGYWQASVTHTYVGKATQEKITSNENTSDVTIKKLFVDGKLFSEEIIKNQIQ